MTAGPRKGVAAPLDLRQVSYFLTVVDELNFTRAAGRLHISTSALSQQVKSLERQLGLALLVRDAQGVRPTAAGRAFASAGRRLVQHGESVVEQAQEAAGLVAGSLKVASLHEVEAVFEPCLTSFHAEHPQVRLSVAAMRHAELLASVRSRAADAGLTWSFLLERADDSDGLAWRRVTSTEVVALLPATSPLSALERVPRGEALRPEPAALFERSYSPITYDYVVEQLYGRDAPCPPPIREVPVTVRAQETMVRSVIDGTFAPVSRPVAEMVRGSLEIRPFSPPWFLDGCVVWRETVATAALTAFLRVAQRDPRGG